MTRISSAREPLVYPAEFRQRWVDKYGEERIQAAADAVELQLLMGNLPLHAIEGLTCPLLHAGPSIEFRAGERHIVRLHWGEPFSYVIGGGSIIYHHTPTPRALIAPFHSEQQGQSGTYTKFLSEWLEEHFALKVRGLMIQDLAIRIATASAFELRDRLLKWSHHSRFFANQPQPRIRIEWTREEP